MSNVIKFQAPFERLKNYDLTPEVRLMKAIITQAIIDSSNVANDPISKKIEMEAKTWIFGESEEFENICLHANIEPFFVRQITRNVQRLHKEQNKLKRIRKLKSKEYITQNKQSI